MDFKVHFVPVIYEKNRFALIFYLIVIVLNMIDSEIFLRVIRSSAESHFHMIELIILNFKSKVMFYSETINICSMDTKKSKKVNLPKNNKQI